MTRMGLVYENLMVNVHLKNSKLSERGIQIVMQATGLDRDASVQTLRQGRRQRAGSDRYVQVWRDPSRS